MNRILFEGWLEYSHRRIASLPTKCSEFSGLVVQFTASLATEAAMRKILITKVHQSDLKQARAENKKAVLKRKLLTFDKT